MDTPNLAQPIQSIKKFDFKKNSSLVMGVVLVVLLGVGTGWFLSGQGFLGGSGSTGGAPGAKVTSSEAGILPENFEGDTAEGTMVEGGLNGEGTHTLEREGGVTKNVYLTSSVIDLQSFVGKKVQVWGETLSAKKAGWLMDVIRVKIIE